MRKLSRAALAVVGIVSAAPLLAQEDSSSSKSLLGAYGGVAQGTAIHGVCSAPFFFGGRVGY